MARTRTGGYTHTPRSKLTFISKDSMILKNSHYDDLMNNQAHPAWTQPSITRKAREHLEFRTDGLTNLFQKWQNKQVNIIWKPVWQYENIKCPFKKKFFLTFFFGGKICKSEKVDKNWGNKNKSFWQKSRKLQRFGLFYGRLKTTQGVTLLLPLFSKLNRGNNLLS